MRVNSHTWTERSSTTLGAPTIWGAHDVLCKAGLYHVAYGTDGYSKTLVSLEQRGQIKALIGAVAEEIVYVYCACERGSSGRKSE